MFLTEEVGEGGGGVFEDRFYTSCVGNALLYWKLYLVEACLVRQAINNKKIDVQLRA